MSTFMNIPLILKSLHDESIKRMTREELQNNVSSLKRKSYKHTM